MRKVWIVIDVETVSDARLILDVAWLVCDSKGNVLESFNACVKEIFDAPYGRYLVSKDGFTSRKLNNGMRKSQWYLDSIDNGEMCVMPFKEIKKAYHAIGKKYNAKPVFCAYNADFDIRNLNANAMVYGCGSFLNPDDLTLDIWHVALDTICNSNKYAKWCIEHDYVSIKGNVKSSCETVARYMINDDSFEERHTALSDCEVEKDILFKARKYKKKLHTNNCMPCVWHCKEWIKLQNRVK